MKSIYTTTSQDHTLPKLLGEATIPEQHMSNPPIVAFPPEVQAAIEAVLPSDDPLDTPDLHVVQYINKLFHRAELGRAE